MARRRGVARRQSLFGWSSSELNNLKIFSEPRVHFVKRARSRLLRVHEVTSNVLIFVRRLAPRLVVGGHLTPLASPRLLSIARIRPCSSRRSCTASLQFVTLTRPIFRMVHRLARLGSGRCPLSPLIVDSIVENSRSVPSSDLARDSTLDLCAAQGEVGQAS